MSNIILNEDQLNAFEKLKEFVQSDDQHMLLLEGAAGSGKTTTVTKFMEWVFETGLYHNICMGSPTHKALKVMSEMCPEKYRSKIVFSTLHSMLGLKHQIDRDGNEIFVRDKKVMSKVPFFEFIIIDESSMIADQLFHELKEQNHKPIKVLFVGDGNQINPINHIMSIPMREDKRRDYNIGHAKLTKIVRQAEGNPIIKYSQQIINNTFEFKSGHKEMVDETGVVMISESQQSVVHQLVNYYFGSSKFDADANFCKIIAWRNATVDFYNKIVRAHKYGMKATKIVLDEKLIVDRPIMSDDGSKVLFNTNEDLVVKHIEIKEKRLFGGESWKYYECEVEGIDKIETIHILHEYDAVKYDKVLRAMAKDAKEESDMGKRMRKWRDYYSFMENFAQVKYNYAITAHNSQGSTYENCFVVNSDIEFNRKEDEKRRIQYTAVTRPRKMLYIM